MAGPAPTGPGPGVTGLGPAALHRSSSTCLSAVAMVLAPSWGRARALSSRSGEGLGLGWPGLPGGTALAAERCWPPGLASGGPPGPGCWPSGLGRSAAAQRERYWRCTASAGVAPPPATGKPAVPKARRGPVWPPGTAVPGVLSRAGAIPAASTGPSEIGPPGRGRLGASAAPGPTGAAAVDGVGLPTGEDGAGRAGGPDGARAARGVAG